MEYEQYINEGIKDLYGKVNKKDEDVVVKMRLVSPDDDPFYAADLIVKGKRYKGYNSVKVYGFLLEKIMGFMKEQGFSFNGLNTFALPKDSEIEISWHQFGKKRKLADSLIWA